ncbi:MAG: mersacidin/lichenicidin family type 2 lantibiotic [Myxococcaceae bacterium]|nr:mersacidin/lichenicidin family type 2 lantibiotic [Myxococcaceae bacterium]
MSNTLTQEMIIRAWKSPAYRASLSEEQRAGLPESPSGKAMTELDEGELDAVTGGLAPSDPHTSCCCNQCC